MSRDIGSSAARTGTRSGELIRVRPGAYIEGPLPAAAWAARETVALAHAAAVVRQLSTPVVLSHESAALLHGCWVPGLDGTTHVLQRSMPSQPGADAISRHHSRRLPPEDITEVHGLPVTSLERTVTDCALTLTPRRALAIADSGLRVLARPDRFERAASAARLEAARARLKARLENLRGARGVVGARAVVEHADGFSESPGETDLRWIAVSRGLPRPTAQLRIDTEEESFYVDLGWILDAEAGSGAVSRLVAAEFDGAGKYAASSPWPDAGPDGRTSLYAEKIREDAIRGTGVTFHRFVNHHLRNADAAFSRLCQGFPPSVLASLAPVQGLIRRPSRRQGH
ncbi:hypothetical protein [Georgenia daeguensis]